MRTLLIASAILGAGSLASAQGPALVVLNKAEASASIISLADGRTIATMPVGDGPHEIAISPDGNWAVAANYGGRPPGSSLTVLALRTRRPVRTIDLGASARPHGLGFMPAGRPAAE